MKRSETEKYYYSPETGMKLLISKELEEKMSKDLFPKQTARAREIISKIDPEQFKAVTGRDLFKK